MGHKLSPRCRWLFLVVVVAAVAAQVAEAKTPRLSYDGEFVLPAQYEDRVRFWVDVFTRYHLDEAIVHDRDRPENVLAIVPLRQGTPAELEEIRERYSTLVEYLTAAEPWEHPSWLRLFKPPVDPEWIGRAQGRVRVQPGQREVFAKGLIRSRHHLDTVRDRLRAESIPEIVAFLPHIESSFDAGAASAAGAAGLWQLMPETARRFLRVDAKVDERLQPAKATRAAAAYLRLAYDSVGSWPLAITAYNYGVNGMRRAVRELGTTDLATVLEGHQSPVFGFACKNFYLQFLAAAHVATHQPHYFPELSGWQVYVVRPGDTLWQIARRHGTTIEKLRSANRETLAETHHLQLGQRLMISG